MKEPMEIKKYARYMGKPVSYVREQIKKGKLKVIEEGSKTLVMKVPAKKKVTKKATTKK